MYFFALLTTYTWGVNTFALRLLTILFGVGTIWLILCLRRQIGAIGALAAAALIAFSPGAVYHSRYFIHESLLVFFTLALVVSVLKYLEKAQPKYLLLASASAAFLFATKETAVISVGVLLIAAFAVAVYFRIRKATTNHSPLSESSPAEESTHHAGQWRDSLRLSGSARRVVWWSLATIATFVFLSILLYSSFFTFNEGISGALKALQFWVNTGTTANRLSWHTYLGWLWQEEGVLLVLCALGAGMAFWRLENRLAVFAALWAFGLLAAYSLIPYKKPWLILNFLIPMAIVGGYALEVAYKRIKGAKQGALAVVLCGVMLAISAYQMIALNFVHYDDDQYIYVNAHTRREFLSLVVEINRLAQSSGMGAETTIAIASPEYWPLPWYLRNYRRVGYFGHLPESRDTIVIGSETDEPALKAALGNEYQRSGSYLLRPGITLVIYVRCTLVESEKPCG